MTADHSADPSADPAAVPLPVLGGEESRRIVATARRVASLPTDRAVQEVLVLARRLATQVAEDELLGRVPGRVSAVSAVDDVIEESRGDTE